MKKTLKILMAIILFAVVLTIATSVNAAAPAKVTSGEIAAYLNEDGKLDTALNTLEVNGALTLDINANAITKVVIQNGGNLTLKNTNANVTSGTATPTDVTAIEVKKGGNLTVDMTNMTVTGGITSEGSVNVTKGAVTSLENKGGSVTLGNNVEVATLTTDVSLTLNKVDIDAVVVTDSKATVTIKENLAASTAITGSDADIVAVNVKDDAKNQIYTSYENLKATAKLYKSKDWATGAGSVATGAEKGKYAVEYTVKYGDVVLGNAVSGAMKSTTDQTEYVTLTQATATSGAQVPDSNKYYDELNVLKPLGSKVFYIIPTVAGKALDDIAIPTSVNTDQPDQTQPEQPGNPADTNKPADDNKGDLDESPKTGDHIIPAATLLAVVVVANVVYFAKSKNN